MYPWNSRIFLPVLLLLCQCHCSSQLDGQPFPFRCLPFSRMAVKPFPSTRCQFKLGSARPTHAHEFTYSIFPPVWQSFPQLLWAKSKGKGKMKRTSRGKSREDEAAKNFASQTFLHIFSTKRMLVFHVCWLISFWGFPFLGFIPLSAQTKLNPPPAGIFT